MELRGGPAGFCPRGLVRGLSMRHRNCSAHSWWWSGYGHPGSPGSWGGGFHRRRDRGRVHRSQDDVRLGRAEWRGRGLWQPCGRASVSRCCRTVWYCHCCHWWNRLGVRIRAH